MALMVRAKIRRPVRFAQARTGLNGALFTMYKVWTMRDLQDDAGNPRPDAERLIPFGAALRDTSLDELPELLNVLCGEMSVVGPRPLHAYYLQRYSEQHGRRHGVRPGLTGLSQVRGGNALSWSPKFDLDGVNVSTCSFLGDPGILVTPTMTVLRQRGLHAPGHSTAPEFTGYGEGFAEATAPLTGARPGDGDARR